MTTPPPTTPPPVFDHLVMMAPADRVEMLRTSLAELGLRESCRRRHQGNGTASYFYCFDNSFLELLWICDREEAVTGPARELRVTERCESSDPSVLPYGIALRNTLDGNGPLPFEAFSYQPDRAAEGPKLVSEASRDLSQPLIFRALRSKPPALWIDGLAGERQIEGGYAEVASWRLYLPHNHSVGPELHFLVEAGLLSVEDQSTGALGFTVTLRRLDGTLDIVRLPDLRA